jgi:hypothetical protein
MSVQLQTSGVPSTGASWGSLHIGYECIAIIRAQKYYVGIDHPIAEKCFKIISHFS